jgi:hypothetical protein
MHPSSPLLSSPTRIDVERGTAVGRATLGRLLRAPRRGADGQRGEGVEPDGRGSPTGGGARGLIIDREDKVQSNGEAEELLGFLLRTVTC